MYSKSPIFDHTDNIIYNTTILTKMFVLSMILQPFSDVFEAGEWVHIFYWEEFGWRIFQFRYDPAYFEWMNKKLDVIKMPVIWHRWSPLKYYFCLYNCRESIVKRFKIGIYEYESTRVWIYYDGYNLMTKYLNINILHCPWKNG